MRLTVGDRLGPYTVLSPIGRGGMGEVYQAHDPRLGRNVAIKLLAPEISEPSERRQRFEREARAVARLNHPNILTLHDVGEHEGALFLVTELLEGGTLRRRLDRGPVLWTVAIGWAAELAEGLATAHERGIVHRDLKPENIWITDDERIKILDFGIAKVVDPASGDEQMTIAASHATLTGRQMVGSVGYMSPEQVRGLAIDAGSDIFSLGAVLYEMLSGRRPFQRDSPISELHAIVHDEPTPLRLPTGCPPALGQLVARCLAKTPRMRFASARDLGFSLQALRAAPLERPAEGADAPHRIAVLPFTDLSLRKDQDYWCEGIADELISALTALPGLQVASRQTSFRAAASGLDGRAIGSELGVASVLEGTVRRAEGHLRVTARLLDVASGYYVWSQAFDRRPEDVFAIQDEIAAHTSRALGILPSGPDASASRLPTTNLAAYEMYLRARQQFHRMRRESLEAARRLYRRAIELDPGFALAHAGVAESSVWLYLDWGGRADDLIDAEDASREAVALGQHLAETHIARALTLSATHEWAAADREFDAALRLHPQLFEARYFYGRSWISRGDLERAAHWLERATAVRPESYDAWILLAMARFARGPNKAATDALRRTLETVGRHLEVEPDEVRPLALGAQALAGLGDIERALQWARRARELAAQDPGSLYNIGSAFAMARQADEAIACLDTAIRHCSDLAWVDHDPFLDNIREDPRFRALLDAVWAARGTPGDGVARARPAPPAARLPAVRLDQRIAYCATRDGVRIAYATVGQGPLLVRVLGWFTHLEMEWAWPDLRAFWEQLAASHTVVRYDGRGIGLSDRWPGAFTEETRELDLEAVLDAVGCGPAALLGISEGGWTAASFAVRHPERVSHLIVYGGYARGAAARPGYDAEEDRALLTLMRKGWGRETPAFRQVFTSQFYREDTDPELLAHFNEMQRASADPETAARYVASCHSRRDGTAIFSKLTTPTLVVHRRDDRSVGFEEGRYLASVVPGAQFVPLAGSAHYFPAARSTESGTIELTDAIVSFLRTDPRRPLSG